MVDFRRQTAYIVQVKDVILSTYTKSDGQPNFITIPNGRQISRVNIMGVVVDTDNNREMVMDDGSDKMVIRSFDDAGPWFQHTKIGDMVMVIGKPREWNNEKYVVPEIIRHIENPGWIAYRKRQLAIKTPEEQPLPLIDLIRSLDQGDGVDTQTVIERHGKPDTEERLQFLMEQGEIFEVRPGRVKVL